MEDKMINPKDLMWAHWSTERKMRCLRIMSDYIRENCHPADYIASWGKYGPTLQGTPEATKAKFREYAEDETKFINALFAFQCCITTDLSFLGM